MWMWDRRRREREREREGKRNTIWLISMGGRGSREQQRMEQFSGVGVGVRKPPKKSVQEERKRIQPKQRREW